jgi:hypothetical protein
MGFLRFEVAHAGCTAGGHEGLLRMPRVGAWAEAATAPKNIHGNGRADTSVELAQAKVQVPTGQPGSRFTFWRQARVVRR